MARLQIPIRLDEDVAEELRARARVEGKSMNQIMREALQTHFATQSIPHDKLTAAIKRVAKRDSKILEALKRL